MKSASLLQVIFSTINVSCHAKQFTVTTKGWFECFPVAISHLVHHSILAHLLGKASSRQAPWQMPQKKKKTDCSTTNLNAVTRKKKKGLHALQSLLV